MLGRNQPRRMPLWSDCPVVPWSISHLLLSGLPIRDTADSQSALRVRRPWSVVPWSGCPVVSGSGGPVVRGPVVPLSRGQ